MNSKKYSVYVIELSKRVFTENVKFRQANPQYNGVLECLYVGMTVKSPEQRLDQHINGTLSNKGNDISSSIVKKYGIYLRPSLYRMFNPMTKEEAIKMEENLAKQLKKMRYAVWWN